MNIDTAAYDHYCLCHGYTDQPCAEMAGRLDRAKREAWTSEDIEFWDKIEAQEVAYL